MLVLSRKLKQEIQIGENIVVTVLKVKGNTVQLGIEAPKEIRILRKELPKNRETADETSPASEVADYTVVFRNTKDDQGAQIDLIPFASREGKPEPVAPSTSHANAAGPDPSNREQTPTRMDNFQFRERVPQAYQKNRLKEIVQQLSTKK